EGEEREELAQLDLLQQINQEQLEMHKQVFVPDLSAFADIGAQAEQMRFDEQAAYYMVGAQLSIPIFSGNSNRLKIKQDKVKRAKTQNKKAQTVQQIQLAKSSARRALKTAYDRYRSAEKQLDAAES